MIHVHTIFIREFRGIRKLTIDFDGQNYAVCGPNGTGKSGIVDALEFALTGNISRLSGKGTGGVSVKEHAPHVDSRRRPDGARVILTGSIPMLGKTFRLERSVKAPAEANIAPDDPDVHRTLRQISTHPEFALSRRELIRYVVSAPGDRAKEVQALLRLDKVEAVRVVMQKIMNVCEREIAPLKRERDTAEENLSRALEIPHLRTDTILATVNTRRSVLSLAPIATLTPTTSLRDGLTASTAPTRLDRIPKAQAIADVARFRKAIALINCSGAATSCMRAIDALTALKEDPAVANGVARERFLQSALGFVETDACPVCDARWEPQELRKLIEEKLQHLDEVAGRRADAEKLLEPIIAILNSLQDALAAITRYGALLSPPIETKALQEFRSAVVRRSKVLEDFLPLSTSIAALRDIGAVPSDALDVMAAMEAAIAAIPEPTEQDAARDYLTVGQERLEAYRALSLRLRLAEGRAALTHNVYDTYARVSTDVLDGIYKQVEKSFSDLYRFINREDEDAFTAHLTSSIGKLGFDVDFYGRGMFPPGAYHSECHQDGMGLCLYLALMKHLLGDSFTFAVLDDVLMSIDSGHRRESADSSKNAFLTHSLS